MHKTLLVGSLAALTLACAGGVAFAQQAPARAMRPDTDGDNRISQSEFVGQRVQRLTALDADRDGSVTAEERRVAMQARRAGRAEARFDRLDADNDGSISRAEFDAAGAVRAGGRADRGPRRMRGPGGRGDMGRMQARGPVVIADVQTRAELTFARLDVDRDGYITAEEGRAARQTLREHRRERRAPRQASPQATASE